MTRQAVESSSLASVGYDEATKELEIEFLSGGVYRYFGVPQSEYEALMTAESRGSYFVHQIRERYDFKRVG